MTSCSQGDSDRRAPLRPRSPLRRPPRAQIYSIGTGKQGFFTYSAGAAIAKVAADGGLNLRVSPFGGTSAYVPGVNAGEQQFGLANELEAHYAVTGEVIYTGKPQPDLRVVAVLTPLYSQFFVKKDSPIKTIADLKGKRIPTGYASQRVLDVLTKGTLANGGLELQRRHARCRCRTWSAAPTNSRRARPTSSCSRSAPARCRKSTPRSAACACWRSITPRKRWTRLRKFIPVAYATQVKPGKGRAGVDEPTWVYAYDYLVLTNDKVADDVVYKLAKLMHDHKAELAANFAGAQRLRSQAHGQGPWARCNSIPARSSTTRKSASGRRRAAADAAAIAADS